MKRRLTIIAGLGVLAIGAIGMTYLVRMQRCQQAIAHLGYAMGQYIDGQRCMPDSMDDLVRRGYVRRVGEYGIEVIETHKLIFSLDDIEVLWSVGVRDGYLDENGRLRARRTSAELYILRPRGVWVRSYPDFGPVSADLFRRLMANHAP